MAPALPAPFDDWFAARGWAPHPHQLALLERAGNPATLLVAPTGGGKTLAGFLPSLIEIAASCHPGLHTLYISPLKALAADIRRNLTRPVEEMALPIRIEDRSGDTGATAKRRQRADPPHILLTTPESLALLLSYPDAPRIFAGLSRVIVDEIHALAESKRGDQLMLCLARLDRLCPGLRRVGLSATVEDPAAIARFLAPARGATRKKFAAAMIASGSFSERPAPGLSSARASSVEQQKAVWKINRGRRSGRAAAAVAASRHGTTALSIAEAAARPSRNASRTSVSRSNFRNCARPLASSKACGTYCGSAMIESIVAAMADLWTPPRF